MKRVLVVDESRAVRETLALVLGRDYVVIQHTPLPDSSLSDKEYDLLIIGFSLALGAERETFSKIACHFGRPVLFLLDSRPEDGIMEAQDKGHIGFLVKPFSPFDLAREVRRLLAVETVRAIFSVEGSNKGTVPNYIEFPYLLPSTSNLAKRFVQSRMPVLLTGEIGSRSKEVAQAMHNLSNVQGAWISAHAAEVAETPFLGKWDDSIKEAGLGGTKLPTLFLYGLESLPLVAQASVLRFFEDAEQQNKEFWLLSYSRVDLLDRVFQGDFLDTLYYRLARLTLKITPLRERGSDLGVLAKHIAEEYGKRMGLGEITFSPDAIDRIQNYLWFGNLGEMESVLARTLAAHRKALIGGDDILFDPEDERWMADAASSPHTDPFPREAPPERGAEQKGGDFSETKSKKEIQAEAKESSGTAVNGDYGNLRVLVGEMAHELKNPMVAIKTFSQLLPERFDDVGFRDQFREAVSCDISRMDELLELLVEFSRFEPPTLQKVSVYEEMRRVLEDMTSECVQRETVIRWVKKNENGAAFADRAQFRYALRCILQTIMEQMKPRGEIQIDLVGGDSILLSYERAEAPSNPLGSYLGLALSEGEEENLSLRLLLARLLLERNGGGVEVTSAGGEKVLVKVKLSAA